MKYLLNEEKIKFLRIANIQTEEREYEEFLQSLYEVYLFRHYSKEQLLNEGFLDKVKDTFQSATGKAKNFLKYSFNQIKKNGEKPSEFVKDVGDVFSGVNIKNPETLQKLLKIADIVDARANLKEAINQNVVDVNNVNDLEKYSTGQKFKWTGKQDSNFAASNYKANQEGLIPGEEYYLHHDPDLDVFSAVSVKEAEYIKNSSGGQTVIAKLRRFMDKHKWVKGLVLAPVVLSVLLHGNADTIGDAIQKVFGKTVNVDNSGVLQSGSNPDFRGDTDQDQKTQAGGGDDVPDVIKQQIDLGGDGQIDDQELNSFKDKIKSLIPDESTDDVSTAATFKVGDYKLSSDQQKWVIEKGVNNVLDQIQKLVAEKGVTSTITVDGDVVGHISSNPGDSDNMTKDGTNDLVQKRTAYGEELNKEIQKEVIKKVKGVLGDKVKVNFKTKTQADSNVKDQVQHKATNNTADQSVVIKYKVDTDGGKTITIKNWQPIIDPKTGASGFGQEPNAGLERGKERGKETGPEKKGQALYDPRTGEYIGPSGTVNGREIPAGKPQNPDLQAAVDKFKSNTSLKQVVGNINNEIELEALLLALVGAVNPEFQVSSGGSNVNRGLTSAGNLIKEDNIPNDVKLLMKIIDQDSTLKQALQKVNNDKEFTELLVRVIVPLLPEEFKKNMKSVKSAFFKARNRWQKIFIEWEKNNKEKTDKEKQQSPPLEDPKDAIAKKSLSPNVTTTTGQQIAYKLVEIRKMQKLAGIRK